MQVLQSFWVCQKQVSAFHLTVVSDHQVLCMFNRVTPAIVQSDAESNTNEMCLGVFCTEATKMQSISMTSEINSNM